MSEINIDSTIVKKEISFSRTEEKLVEMSNGCICCTLRQDLLQEVERLSKDGRYDAIIIESTGVWEPVPVAQTFSYIDEETWIDLSKWTRLDTMVTVVDAVNFLKDFESNQDLLERNMAMNEQDTRSIVNLLVDQIEFCDVLVVNKFDEIKTDDRRKLLAILKALQPTAKIITTNYWKVSIWDIVNTGLFSFDQASQSAGWIQEFQHWHQHHTPETQEYWITSFVYERKVPFHPQRLRQLLQQPLPWIIRSKGTFWLASRNDVAGSWSQSWNNLNIWVQWRWLSSFSEKEIQQSMPEYYEYYQSLKKQPYMDRQTQIVIIWIDYDRVVIESLLDSCLLSSEEFTQNIDSYSTDPFRILMN